MDFRDQTTLERIAQSVVAIEVDQTRAFDTEWNASAQATGFIVDAERVEALRRRISKNPNSQVNRALRELGLVKEKR
jgi:hypothetical protein